MIPVDYQLPNGETLHIRQAEPEDAAAVIRHIEEISGESNFVSMAPGEFGISEEEEMQILKQFRDAENQLFILGTIGEEVIVLLNFSARNRPRLRHTGSLGMSVVKKYWGLGIGGRMLDILLEWARQTGVITKINLQVRPTNHRAIRLYLSRGFIVEGRISRTMYIDGAYADSYAMGLELD